AKRQKEQPGAPCASLPVWPGGGAGLLPRSPQEFPMTRSFSYRPVALVLAGIAAAVALTLPGRPPTVAAEDKNPKDAKAADPAAVERTRATVRMLDNLHKGYVVNITETYVKAKEQTPAATVLKKVFAFMEKNGDGTGRLIDVTGSPLRDKNVAVTVLEKQAAQQPLAASRLHLMRGTCFSARELMQNRSPVGRGPSSKT